MHAKGPIGLNILTLCNAIKKEICNKNEAAHENPSEGFTSHLTPKEHKRLVNLVGRRFTVNEKINGKTVEVLWDTGAQASIVSADRTFSWPIFRT